MGKLLLISIFLLLASISLSAQTPPSLDCPTISVSGPSGIPNLDELMLFTAKISKDRPNVKYVWTVVHGEIISGQGTLAIGVKWQAGVDITATIEPFGLPLGCASTASVTASIEVLLTATKMGDISGPTYKIERSFLATIEKSLQENPNTLLYIVLRFKQNTSKNKVLRLKQSLTNELKKAKIENDRISFKLVKKDADRAVFWLVPAGSELPSIDR